MMRLNEFQDYCKRTMPEPIIDTPSRTIYGENARTNYAMGIAGEAGEVVDIVKKEVFHGHLFDRNEIMNELGDVLHYVAGLAAMYNYTLDEVAAANLNKLRDRYPDGFSQEASRNRKDVSNEQG